MNDAVGYFAPRPFQMFLYLNESPVFSRADLPIWWTWWILLIGVEFDAK